MKLAEKSRRKIEEFFRHYLRDEQFRLPEIIFYGGPLARLLTTGLKVEGIAVGRRVFILPTNFRYCEKQGRRHADEALIVHEIAHVLQYGREGFWRFLRLYVSSYRANLKRQRRRDAAAKSAAYYEIPFEIEARRIAAAYVDWSEKGKLLEAAAHLNEQPGELKSGKKPDGGK